MLILAKAIDNSFLHPSFENIFNNFNSKTGVLSIPILEVDVNSEHGVAYRHVKIKLNSSHWHLLQIEKENCNFTNQQVSLLRVCMTKEEIEI